MSCDHEDETERAGECCFEYDKQAWFKMPCIGCKWRNDVPPVQCKLCKHFMDLS